MKKSYSIIFATSLLITCCPWTAFTSCNNNPNPPPKPDDQYFQYILDRTFPIEFVADRHSTSKTETYFANGTAWVIDYVRPTNLNDSHYQFYLAISNTLLYNVFALRVGFRLENERWCFADKSLINPTYNLIPWDKYIEFADCVEPEYSTKDFSFEHEYQDEEYYKYYEPVIDFSVLKVDFDTSLLTPIIKNKLDNLISFKEKNGYINKFVNSDDPEVLLKDKYSCGYPTFIDLEKGIYGSRPQNIEFIPKDFSYYGKTSDDLKMEARPIGLPQFDPNGNPIRDGKRRFEYYKYDASAGYESKESSPFLHFSSSTANGAMLLTEDFEVCGIYWGEKSQTEPYTSFAALKNNGDGDKTKYDFISKWLTD